MELQTLEATVSPENKSPVALPPLNGAHSLEGQAARDTTWRIVLLPVSSIGPNPFQPRSVFDEAEMEELVASVRAHGVLQPVTVRTNAPETPTNGKTPKKASPTYHLIAGERRLRACRAAGRKTIPAIVRDDLSDAQAAELAIVENVQRANLSVIEEARGYRRLMLTFHLKEERIAKKVGKSVQTVRETLRLLVLPEDVQGLLSAKKLTASHGHELLRVAPFERLCSLVASAAVKDGLTAAALGRNILPNVRELRDKKLLTELDFRTKFDWRRECGSCPHKAYIASGYGTYCLLPAEWVRKQNEALERQKQEAARILDEAKRGSDGQVDVAVLPPGSFRDLSYGQVPAGCCASCPCRSESPDPRDPTKARPICLDPARLKELAQAERQAHLEARQRKFLAHWHDARQKLSHEVEAENTHSCAAIALLPLVTGQHLRYGGMDSWRTQARQVAHELALDLSVETLLDKDTPPAQALAALQSLDVNSLLRFLACLLLAHEARGAVQFGGETPLLSFALGFEVTPQEELPHEEFPDGEDYDEEPDAPESEDD